MAVDYTKEESRVFSIRARFADTFMLPAAVNIVAVNEVKGCIYQSVIDGEPIPETKELRGKPGVYSTKINGKYRLLWAWTSGERSADPDGITIINVVASDKQNQ